MKIRRNRFIYWVVAVVTLATLMCGWCPLDWPWRYTIAMAVFIGACSGMLATVIAHTLWPDVPERSNPKPQEWDKDYES